MTRDEAIALAKKHAAKSPHLYTLDADGDGWFLHEWVVDAILEAFEEGREDGALSSMSVFLNPRL